MEVFTSTSRGLQDAGRGKPFMAAAAGFTLIEVLITITVVAILARLTVGSLLPLLAENRIVTRVNSMVGLLHLARSEAIRRNRHVVLCHSHDGMACIRQGDWSGYWLVFVDTDRDRRRDADEALVAVHQASQETIRTVYRAFGSRHYLTYRPDGRTRTNGTFTFCDPRVPSSARAIIITKSGRPRLSRTRADDGPLTCR